MGDGVQSRVFRFSPVLFLIFTSLFVGVLSIITTFLVVPAFEADSGSASSIAKLVGVCVGFLLVLVFIIYAATYKIIVTADSLVVKSLFSRRELFFEEVKGFNVVRNYNSSEIHFFLKNKKKFKMALFMQNETFFLEIISSLFIDLDVVEKAEEIEELKRIHAFFDNDILDSIASMARKFAKGYNFVGLGILFWLIFKPQPYAVVVVAALLYPFVAFIFLVFFLRVTKLDSKKYNFFLTIYLGMLYPCVGLFFLTLRSFSIYSYDVFLIIFLVVAAGITFVFFLYFTDFKKKFISIFFVLLFSLPYSYGVIMNINYFYDKSTPIVFESVVVDKFASEGLKADKNYYLVISEFGDKQNQQKVIVSQKIFFSVELSDSVEIFVRSGFFKIPWYYVAGLATENLEFRS
ncbi:MAG: hypothetical protein JXR63_02975 [Spirochaetales bacterium]|nr:hypothetical protein [Spirochaetales bacterium]